MEYNYYQQMPYQTPGNGRMPRPPKRGCGFGIAALCIGILSMTICCTWGFFIGLIGVALGIVGLCRKESAKGLSIAGIITSGLGIVLGIAMLILFILPLSQVDNYQNMSPEEIQQWMLKRIEQLENGNIGSSDGTEDNTLFAEKHFQSDMDQSVVYFYDDGSYLWYKDDKNHDDDYTSGTYEVYRGKEALSYIANNIKKSDLPEEKIKESYGDDPCCLVLHVETLVQNGEKDEKYSKQDRVFIGKYVDGKYGCTELDSKEELCLTKVD